MTSRFLFIPNTDSDITYTQDWQSTDSTQFDSLGNFGPPFESSLHGLSGASGSLSYFFHGNSINVLGTVFVKQPPSHGSIWGCFIDGVSLGPPTYPNTTENNWSLCQQDLPDGPHELQVVANTTSDPVYIDYLLYAPSLGIPLDNTTIYLRNNDPAVSYDSSWTVSLNEELTSAPEGELTITFVGESLDYYGFIPSDLSHTSSSAQYSIDGQSVTTFTLPGLPPSSSSPDVFNQKFFSTGHLSQGSHTITVRNIGNSAVTPLTFSFAIVTNGTSRPPSNPSPNPNPTSIPGGLSNPHHTNHEPAIIGGVVAGAVVVAIIVVSVVIRFVRRRFNKRIHLVEDHTELQRASTINRFSGPQFLPMTAAPLSTAIVGTGGAMMASAPNPSPSRTPPADIPSRSNTLITLQPRVSMSVAQQAQILARVQSQYYQEGSASGSGTSTAKSGIIVAVNRSGSTTSAPIISRPGQGNDNNGIPQPAPEHVSANEVTPMLGGDGELDEEDYDGPPPTYTSRADNSVSSEKRYLVRQNQ